MDSTSYLPTFHKKSSSNRVLRVTEKYLLAIALVAFCLVFLGAVYLPRDLPSSNGLSAVFEPGVNNPHEHGEGRNHKLLDQEKFIRKVRSAADLKQYVDTLDSQLQENEKKIGSLKSEIDKLKLKDSKSVKLVPNDNIPEDSEEILGKLHRPTFLLNSSSLRQILLKLN